jgi:hypothetical protein
MEKLDDFNPSGTNRLIDNLGELSPCFFILQLGQETFVHLHQNSFKLIEGQVRHGCVNHEHENVQK